MVKSVIVVFQVIVVCGTGVPGDPGVVGDSSVLCVLGYCR